MNFNDLTSRIKQNESAGCLLTLLHHCLTGAELCTNALQESNHSLDEAVTNQLKDFHINFVEMSVTANKLLSERVDDNSHEIHEDMRLGFPLAAAHSKNS